MKDAKLLLTEAAGEIKALRRQNDIMSARLDMFDKMMKLFHAAPNYGENGLMSPDLVYSIEKYLKEQEQEPVGKSMI